MLSEDSIMQPGRGLFDAPGNRIKIVDDGAGNRTLEKTAFTQRLFNFESKEQMKLTPNADGLLFVPMQARDKYPLIWTPNKEYTGDTVGVAAETDDLKALVAYVQKLGMNRGKWRDLFEPQEIEVTDVTLPRSSEWMATAKRSTSGGASAAMVRKGMATGRLRPSCSTSGRETSAPVYSNSGWPRNRSRPMATCCGPSPAAYAARRCRLGMSCR